MHGDFRMGVAAHQAGCLGAHRAIAEGRAFGRTGRDSDRKGLPVLSAGRRREPARRSPRIENLPDLPKYTEVEPDQPRTTLEEKPRAAKSPQVAALAPNAETSSTATWRRNAVPFRDLNSRP